MGEAAGRSGTFYEGATGPGRAGEVDTSAGTTEEPPNARSGDGNMPRPDLQVPLYPAESPLASFVRTTLVRLRAPRFAEAHLANRRGFLLPVALWAGQFAVVAPARPYLSWTAGVLVMWLLIRAWALVRAERQQRRYERRWLAVQTEVLRDTWFEVVRCTVRHRLATGPGHRDASSREPARTDASSYELTRPGDVRELLDRQASERGSGQSSRVVVEFAFPLPGRQFTALDAVSAGLTEIEMVAAGRRPSGAGVRFPRASYHPEPPARGRRGRHWPSRSTFWVLGAPVLSMAAPETGPVVRADVSADGGSAAG